MHDQTHSVKHRPDLPNRVLNAASIGLVLLIVGIIGARVLWDQAEAPSAGAFAQWLALRPGSAWLQAAAALGSLLLLVPFVFSVAKRTGLATLPNRWMISHVMASLLGILLVSLHALASLQGPPLLLLALLFILATTGITARNRVSELMAATLGTKRAPFTPPSAETRAELAQLIEQKTALLAQLDAGASEALFSVTLKHWLHSPRLALAYQHLVRRENKLMNTRGSVHPLQAWWRPLHLICAWLFLLGLLAHIVVVIFFADYAADGTVYWWHLSAVCHRGLA